MATRKKPASDAIRQMQAHACEASSLLKAMGNEQRLLILCQLVGREASVGELLAQHLSVLREADLVQTRREGQSIFYSLPEGPVHRVMQTLHDIYCGNGR